jgi:3-oxoacyl-(acyl-carrier-protein) synthase
MENEKKIVVISRGKFGPAIESGGPDISNSETIASSGINLSTCRAASIDTKRLLPGISTRLVDRQSLQAGIATKEAIEIIPEDIDWERAGVILGSTFGATASMFDFYHNIVTEGVDYISPMEFPNTVSNAAASRVGIWLSLKGHCVSISNGNLSGLDAVGFAYKEIKKNLMDYYVAGGSEEISEVVKRIYSRIFEDRHQIDRNHGISHEVLYEGAGMLLLTTKEQAEEKHIKPLCIIDGYTSGTIKQDQNQFGTGE